MRRVQRLPSCLFLWCVRAQEPTLQTYDAGRLEDFISRLERLAFYAELVALEVGEKNPIYTPLCEYKASADKVVRCAYSLIRGTWPSSRMT